MFNGPCDFLKVDAYSPNCRRLMTQVGWIVFLFGLGFNFSCSDPYPHREIVKAFWQSFQTRDWDKAESLLLPKALPKLRALQGLSRLAPLQINDAKLLDNEILVVSEKDGEITYKVVSDGVTIALVKAVFISGNWKVDFYLVY